MGSGVGDGCTVQIMKMMRGMKNRDENKPTASPKNSEPMRGQQEHDEEKIIQMVEPVKGQQEPKIEKIW